MATTSNLDTEGSVTTLPTEIIAGQILLPKVAAKSLMRFKCVSKSYNKFISSPEFIDLHLRQSLSSDSNRLLILTRMDDSNLYSFDLDSPGSSAVSISLPYTSDKSFRGALSVLINGLVCVTWDFSLSLPHLIINPSTGVYRVIPPKRYMFVNREYLVSFGFGFDDINQDYKLVRVAQSIEDPYNDEDGDVYERGVTVYSLKESSWKFVELVETNGNLVLFNKNAVAVKNYLLHWLFTDYHTFRIRCFDVRFDNWVNEVPLMDLFIGMEERGGVAELGVPDDYLCFSTLINSTGAVWIMKEYGIKESWVKLFKFSHSSDSNPFGYRGGTEHEVLVRKEGESLCLRDIELGTYKDIVGLPNFHGACLCKGSLVLVPGGSKIGA